MIRLSVVVLADHGRARACTPRRARPRTSATSLPICIPVAGPWVAIPPPHGGFATATWRLACPQGVVGGVDARASEPAVAVEFPGLIGSPVNPGITTRGSLLFKGTYAGRAPPGHELPAVHRLHSRRGRRTAHARRVHGAAPRRQTRHADHGPRRDASGGRGHARPRDVRVPLGERLLTATHSVGLYTEGVPIGGAARRRPRRPGAPRLEDARQRDAARPADRRARRGAGPGGVRAVRIDWPIGLLALLLVPIVVVAYLAIERRRARYAIHYTNIEVLASVTGRSPALAVVRPSGWSRCWP